MSQRILRSLAIAGVLLGNAVAISTADAAAVRAGMFTANTLAGNDDGSTGLVPLGFDVNFFGVTYDDLYVNNNGNVTFDSALGTYTPFNLLSTSQVIIAPFFADVDTRNSDDVTYGIGTVDGRDAFGVNWLNVGYYNSHATPTNSFQLVIIDRSDIAVGDFDFEFNFDDINWETGDASSGSGGLGGNSARSGWSNGDDMDYEIVGSAINGALLDSNLTTGLIYNSLNSDVDGRYLFRVRNGNVQPAVAPAPGALALFGLGLLGFGALRRRRA